MSRRRFLYALVTATGAASGVCPAVNSFADPATEATSHSNSNPFGPALPPHQRTSKMFLCDPSIVQVRRGDADPQEYARGLERCIPEAAEAIRRGTITGIRYNPSRDELIGRITESYRRSGIPADILGSPKLQGLIATNAETLDALESDKAATILPSTIECIGNHVPPTICLRPMILTSPFAVHDGDLRSIILHELEHAKDFTNGFTIGAKHFTYHTIKKTEYSLPFIEATGELRALYDEIERSWAEAIANGSAISSSDYLANVIGRYVEIRHWIKSNCRTPQERGTREELFYAQRGITVEGTPSNPALRINLHGKTGTIFIEKGK